MSLNKNKNKNLRPPQSLLFCQLQPRRSRNFLRFIVRRLCVRIMY